MTRHHVCFQSKRSRRVGRGEDAGRLQATLILHQDVRAEGWRANAQLAAAQPQMTSLE